MDATAWGFIVAFAVLSVLVFFRLRRYWWNIRVSDGDFDAPSGSGSDESEGKP
jgi:hypothetical protein